MASATSPRRSISDEDILDAAVELFAAGGYGATSVDQIALRAGTTKPTFYARFGSKEEIYARAVEREAELMTAYLFSAYDRAEREGLRRGVTIGMQAAFEFAAERPNAIVLLFDPDPSAPPGDAAARAVARVIERVAGIMRRALGRRGDIGAAGAELLGALLVSLSNAGIRHARQRGLSDLDAVGEAVASFAVAAVKGLDAELFARVRRR